MLTGRSTQHLIVLSGFARHAADQGGVAVEPWYLSYRPLVQEAKHLLTPTLLLAAWRNKSVTGAALLGELIGGHFIMSSHAGVTISHSI